MDPGQNSRSSSHVESSNFFTSCHHCGNDVERPKTRSGLTDIKELSQSPEPDEENQTENGTEESDPDNSVRADQDNEAHGSENKDDDVKESVIENIGGSRSKDYGTDDGEKEMTTDSSDTFFDRWIRRAIFNCKPNEFNLRYDLESHRWYLKLSALDVKEIRATIWQRQEKE